DGNSVVLDAPGGLVVVDTGRHTEHQEKLLAHARRVGKPIAVIVNTHWHLDHSGGNAELRAVYPDAEIVATRAVEGALVGFFPQSRAASDELIASGWATPQQLEDLRLGRAAIADTRNLLPTARSRRRARSSSPGARSSCASRRSRPPRPTSGSSIPRRAPSSPAISSSPRCRSSTPAAPTGGAPRSARSRRRRSSASSPATATR
ncbi:MAG: MBL fold metallo-hydrolase, partial [Deltaproteobacteria bacterium]|nr:MBL fold metallo-hydrolase [Kofleriaceae bacterium]